MANILAIFKKELRSYFVSPIAYAAWCRSIGLNPETMRA